MACIHARHGLVCRRVDHPPAPRPPPRIGQTLGQPFIPLAHPFLFFFIVRAHGRRHIVDLAATGLPSLLQQVQELRSVRLRPLRTTVRAGGDDTTGIDFIYFLRSSVFIAKFGYPLLLLSYSPSLLVLPK